MPTIPNGMTPNVAAYSGGDMGGVNRTEVAGGASRFALEYDRGTQQFNVTMIMDATKYAVWNLFYLHIIKKGAIAFDMPLDSGFGTQTHSVNIMPGSYSVARTAGSLTVVTFMVDTENKGYELSASEAASYIELYNGVGSDMGALFARIAQFANVDTLVLDF